MNPTIFYLFAAAFLLTVPLNAQDNWSLERCIDYAQKNNLTIRQAENTLQIAEINVKGAKLNQLPSIDMGMNGGWQFGRTIDPTTNTFNNQGIGFNSYQLNAGILLFNGGNLSNAREAAELNSQASAADLAATVNNMGLSIANSYLSALMTKEQLDNARRQAEITQQQLERTRLLISTGTIAPNDSINLIAQLATNQQTVIQLENTYQLNILNIKQLLQLSADEDFAIEAPNLDLNQAEIDQQLVAPRQLFQQALSTQPQIRAAEFRQQAAETNVDQARGAMYPRVSLFANVNSNFSSAFSDFQNPDLSDAQLVLGTPAPVQIDGMDAMLSQFSVEGITFPSVPYFNQLDNNFGQTIGLSVNIPVFNSGQGRFQTQRAELNAINSQLQYQQAEQQLRTDVERAVADARAAKSNFAAAQRSVEAAQIAFENQRGRLELGAANTFDFNTAQLNLQNAETDQIRAKYEYLFRLKILDFYIGKPLTINQ